MSTPDPLPGGPTYSDTRWHNEQADLLKKIAGLLTALVALALASVVIQLVVAIGANQTSDEVSDRLDDIRQNTATP